MQAVLEAPKVAAPPQPFNIDLGSGGNKRAGFTGIDSLPLPGVDILADLKKRWPFEDASVDEAHSSHFLEHLTNLDGKWERVHFFNELHRVLKVGGKATIVIPHWCSNRYYGDPTHKEPFSEMGFYYLLKSWRDANAPHTDAANVPGMYACDFDATVGPSLRPDVLLRSQEYQQYAMQNYKEACMDLVATLVRRAP